jgi:antitoxin YefM
LGIFTKQSVRQIYIAASSIALTSILNRKYNKKPDRPYNILSIGKPKTMSLTQTQVTYTEAQANLDELCEQVINDRDAIIITRKYGENVALIAADELASLLETVYLLRSPKNADRLLSTLKDAQARIEKNDP